MIDSEDRIDATQFLSPDDLGRLVARRKGNMVAISTDRGGIEYRSIYLPLDLYVAKRQITGEQYEAGERLHALWRGSIVAARYTTMRFTDATTGYDAESIALMPRDYFRAMDAVRGFLAKRMVRQVCCFGEPAGRGGMVGLRDGLDNLVRHFRL